MLPDELYRRVVAEHPTRDVWIVLDARGVTLCIVVLGETLTISRTSAADVWTDYETFGRKRIAEAK